MKMNTIKTTLILSSLLLLASSLAAAQPTAFTNVTLIDGTGTKPSDGMTVLIKDRLIKNVFKSNSKELPADVKILDYDGHYLIPGLINTHVHLSNILVGRTTHSDLDDQHELMLAELKRMLYGGVTSIRDMAGDARLLSVAKRSLFLNQIIGPDLYFSALMAGPDFMNNDPRVLGISKGFKPGEVSWAQTVTHETDVELAVARAAGTHPTGLKFYIGIESDVLLQLSKEAHRQGLKAWAHSTVFPDRPIDVVKAGVDGISHVCFIPWQDKDLKPSENIPYTHTSGKDARPRFNPELVQAYSPEMKALYEEMIRRNTLLDITLSAYGRGSWAALGCTPQLLIEIARAASRAGVMITTGTDYFIDINEPFPSVIKEIEYLVDQQVLSPLQVITAATLHGARAIGIEETHGTIKAGKVANMVLLKADPLEDIKALREVALVIKNGQLYPGEEYNQSTGE